MEGVRVNQYSDCNDQEHRQDMSFKIMEKGRSMLEKPSLYAQGRQIHLLLVLVFILVISPFILLHILSCL
jgi:hypothetical protein